MKKLEKLQERALRIVYQDDLLDYENLLTKSGQLGLRMNMIRVLSIEMFKCVNGINPAYLNEMFTVLNSEYNFRNQSRLDQPKFNTKTFGYKSFNYFGAKIWNLIPTHTKSTDDLSIFRSNIYKWCQTEYAQNVLDQIGLW